MSRRRRPSLFQVAAIATIIAAVVSVATFLRARSEGESPEVASDSFTTASGSSGTDSTTSASHSTTTTLDSTTTSAATNATDSVATTAASTTSTTVEPEQVAQTFPAPAFGPMNIVLEAPTFGEGVEKGGILVGLSRPTFGMGCSSSLDFTMVIRNDREDVFLPSLNDDDFYLTDNTGKSFSLSFVLGSPSASCYSSRIDVPPVEKGDVLYVGVRTTSSLAESSQVEFGIREAEGGSLSDTSWTLDLTNPPDPPPPLEWGSTTTVRDVAITVGSELYGGGCGATVQFDVTFVNEGGSQVLIGLNEDMVEIADESQILTDNYKVGGHEPECYSSRFDIGILASSSSLTLAARTAETLSESEKVFFRFLRGSPFDGLVWAIDLPR